MADLFETNADAPHRGDWADDDSSSSSDDDNDNDNDNNSYNNKAKQEAPRLLQYFDGDVPAVNPERKSRRRRAYLAGQQPPQWTWTPAPSPSASGTGAAQQADRRLQASLLVVGFGRAGAMYAFHRFATAGAVSAAQGVPELVASMTSTAAAAKPQPKSAVAIKAAAKEFCHIYRNSALPDLLVCAVTAPVSPSEAFEFAATLLTHVHADRVLAFDAALKSSINGLYDDPENDDSDYDYDSGHRGALVCALATAAWRRDGRLPARALPTANMVTGAPAALLSHCEVIGTPAALLLALQESVEISPELLLAMDAVITSDNSQLGTVAPALAPLQADALRAAFKSAGPASDSALASVPGAIHLVLSASTTTAATFVRPTPDSLYL